MGKIAKDYYLTEVDKLPNSIYCMHDYMGEDGIKPHQHLKDQLLYTEGGMVHVKVQGVTYFLPARHYMWIPSGLEHSIHPGSTAVIMRNLYFPFAQSDDSFFSQAGIYPVNELLLQMLIFSNQWHGDIVPQNKIAFGFVSSLRDILPQLSLHQLPLILPMPSHSRLIQVIHYMEQNMQNGIALPQLAQQFGFSERSLSRLFKNDVDMSFIQYHTIQRMLKALELLLTNKLSVKETVALVGYNSIPTFSATFRKIVGISPSAYLKLGDGFGHQATNGLNR